MRNGYEPEKPGNFSMLGVLVFLLVMAALAYYGADMLRGTMKPSGFGPGMCVGC